MQDSRMLDLARRFAEAKPEVRRELLRKMREAGIDFSALPIPAITSDDAPVAASYAQRRLYFLWQLEPLSNAYNLHATLELEGEVDIPRLQRTCEQLVRRHAALRTVFRNVSGEVFQIVQSNYASPFQVEDLRRLPEKIRIAHAVALAGEAAEQAFDLEAGPLIRIVLLRLGETDHRLLFTLHHIVCDGLSMDIIIKDFASIYESLCNGGLPPEGGETIRYADYALWQKRYLEAGGWEDQLSYWVAKLGGVNPALDLPTEPVRPSPRACRGARHAIDLGEELSGEILEAAQLHGVTPFMFLLAVYYVLLHRLTGQSDISIGVPIANRNRAETEGVVGFFVNTQVLRATVYGQQSFADLLQQVRTTSIEAQTHQEFPFDKIVEVLNPSRSLTQNPLFQVKYNYQRLTYKPLRDLTGLQLKALVPGQSGAHFDLSLDITDENRALSASMTYSTDAFDEAAIVRLMQRWCLLLRGVLIDPMQPIAALALLDEEERQALEQWSHHSVVLPEASILDLFGKSAAVPDALALRAGRDTISYGELDARSNRLARFLRARGWRPRSRILLCAERSIGMVIGLLAILKAGCTYVPVDPGLPPQRLKRIVSDVEAMMILCEEATVSLATLSGIEAVQIDGLDLSSFDSGRLECRISPDDVAYIIYTSGSTGLPKGVAIGHGALANYVMGVLKQLDFPAGLSMAMASTPAADLGHTMLFGALCSGRTLHLVETARCFDPDAFAAYMAEHEVGILKIVPSHLGALLQASAAADVLPRHTLVLGGEATSWPLFEKIACLRPDCRIVNHYGPTEATVGALAGLVQKRDDCRNAPLGWPLPNASVYIVDDDMTPVPIGSVGEVYIGGKGLAHGYLNAHAMTAERFVPNPFSAAGARLYRTGDRARRLFDGAVEFLGRVDDQVKIRGYRVELAEIEWALRARPEIRDAAADWREIDDGHGELRPRLIAYCVPSPDCRLDSEAVRTELSRRLPDYMLPQVYVTLDALPLNANGKLDRKALPLPERSVPEEPIAPRSKMEEALAEIWRSVLGGNEIGIHDNFFERGGDSILGLQIIARAKKKGIRIKPKDIFEYQTIARLGAVAQWIERSSSVPAVEEQRKTAPLVDLSESALKRLPVPLSEIEDIYPLTPMQQGMLFHSLLDPSGGMHINQRTCVLTGAFDLDVFMEAWDDALAAHDILRTFFVWDGLDAPLQCVKRQVKTAFDRHDWRGVPEEMVEQRLTEFLRADRARGFDLAQAPLVRVAFIEQGDRQLAIVWTLHHLLLDGWSSACLLDRIFSHYCARVFPEAPVMATGLGKQSFRPYVEWVGQQDPSEAAAFWTDYFEDFRGPTLLADHVEPHRSTTGHASLVRELAADLTEILRNVGRDEHITINTLLQGAIALELARYTREPDVVFGSVVSGRNAPVEGIETMVGMLINVLPVRVKIEPDVEAGAWLRALQDENAALRNYEYSLLAAIQACSGVPHGTPLFDVLLVVQNYPVSPVLWERLGIAGIDAFQSFEQTNYPLTIMATPRETRLRLRLDYDTSCFDAALIGRIVDGLERRLETLARHPRTPLRDLPAPMREAIAGPAAIWSSADLARPPAGSLTELIEAQIRATPDSVALLYREEELTYAELDRRVNRLARRLRQMGVGPDVRVAVCLDRTPELVIGLLAVLKAGGAYVPLDPAQPASRLAAMIEQAAPHVVLTSSKELTNFEPGIERQVAVVCLDRDEPFLDGPADDGLDDRSDPRHLAYAIFTSGSTGAPKGVAISRESLRNFLLAARQDLPIGAQDCMLALTAPTFDISTLEYFLPLLCGAKIALAGRMINDPDALLAWAQKCGVTAIQATPTAWRILSQAEAFQNLHLRLALCGGEAMPQDLAAQLEAHCESLFNLYGPTEASVWALRQRVLPGTSAAIIGLPFANVRVVVFDDALEPVWQGMTGELYIGGVGLARGYLGRPGLTAERFIPDPFTGNGARLYRTGDLVRRGAADEIEFIGRTDDQIKIRGFRIEPGEIEAVLLAHPDVAMAVVLPRPTSSGVQLVAYVVSRNKEREIAQSLDVHLRSRLPDYMIPSRFVALEAMPLTSSGKLDRAALPEPQWEGRSFVPPETDLEIRLAEIWREVLGVDAIGRFDSFFELGGHSLLAAQATAKIRARLAIDIPFDQLFRTSTLEGLAGSLRDRPDTSRELAFMSALLTTVEESGASER
jgi:amino acid adenylation domain-containing protein